MIRLVAYTIDEDTIMQHALHLFLLNLFCIVFQPKKAMKLNIEKSLSKRWNLNKDTKLYGGCTPKLILLWLIVALLISLLVTIIVVIARQAMMPPSVRYLAFLSQPLMRRFMLRFRRTVSHGIRPCNGTATERRYRANCS